MLRTNKIPLSPIQISQAQNKRAIAIDIEGPIDIYILQSAFDLLIANHEILRTNVAKDNSGYYLNAKLVKQEKYNSDELPFQFLNLNNLASPNINDLYQTLKFAKEEKFFDQPFDLSNGPLWRAILVKFGDNKSQFAMVFSHIIYDSALIQTYLQDLSFFYNTILDIEMPGSKYNYLSSKMTDLHLSEYEVSKRLDFWENKLSDLNIISLETDYIPVSDKTNHYEFVLDPTLVNNLMSGSLAEYSLDKKLLSIFYILLHRYTMETDICIGVTSPSFFNLVPLRVLFSRKDSLLDLIRKVGEALDDAIKNKLKIDMITEKALSEEAKLALTTYPFNITFAVNEINQSLTLGNSKSSYPIEIDTKHNHSSYFDLNINVYPDNKCKCFIKFNPNLFTPKTIESFAERFGNTLRYIADHPQTNISTIPLLLEKEKKDIHEFNNTDKFPVSEWLIPDFFHQRAISTPSDIFIAYHLENEDVVRLTYEEVEHRSNQLANYLIEFGAGPNINIGLCLSRSPELIIGILAVLKTGGILVTIETEINSNPLENPVFALKVNDVDMIVIDNQTQRLFNHDIKKTIFNIATEDTVKYIQASSKEYHSPKITAQDPAYTMYTSGSTGKPKCVTCNHIGFANLLDSLKYDLELPDEIKIICTTSPTFDAFLYDILVALASLRGQFHITYESGRFSPKVLEKIIRNENINFGVFLPELLDHLDPNLPLIFIITMGAAPHPDTLLKWMEVNGYRIIKIWNGIGHTETGICLSLCLITKNSDPNLIGRPIRNMKNYILDNNLLLCPPNVLGEIYVKGPGLARGYQGNEALTNEKFPQAVMNSDQSGFNLCQPGSDDNPDNRLYASGDYGCYQIQQDGSLSVKFKGRKDGQVKIHGVRVELPKIENVLREIDLIKEAVVLYDEKSQALTAYIVPSQSATIDEIKQEIQKSANKVLSRLSRPKNIVIVQEIPVTKNGKVDTKKLESMKIDTPEIKPTEKLTDLQIKLKNTWSKVLGIPASNFNIDESFTDLGGTSLHFATMETELKKITTCTSYVLDNFMTINSLSQQITVQANGVIFTKQGPFIYSSTSVVFFTDPQDELQNNADLNTSPRLGRRI